MDTLLSMQVFRAVAELNSFAAAGRRLELSPAMVSKHVMHLERRLNTRLFNRTSRHVSLTESGALYFEHSRQMLDALDEVEIAITKATVVPRGNLRISGPVWLANPAFVAVLADYRKQYPEVTVEMDLSGRLVNLVEEGFDLALRASNSPGDNLIARPIASVPFYIVGTPGYLNEASWPLDIGDLLYHSMLWYSLAPTEIKWPNNPGDKAKTIRLNPVLQSTNESLLHLAALEGMGLALLPKWLIDNDLQTGRLIRVLPERDWIKATLYAVYPSRKYLSSKVRTFIDFLLNDPRINMDG